MFDSLGLHSLRRIVSLKCCIAFYLAMVGGSQVAFSQGYRLEIVARPGDVIDGKTISEVNDSGSLAVINNKGEVAFVAATGGTRDADFALFTDRRFIAAAGDVIDGFILGTLDDDEHRPRLTDDGTLLFASFDAVFAGDQALVRRGDVIDGFTLLNFGRWAATINIGGQTAFRAIMNLPSAWDGIFTLDSVIAVRNEEFDGRVITSFRNEDGMNIPSINEAGKVAFFARFDGGEAIFTQSGVVVETGDKIDGQTLSFIDSEPSLYNLGEIAFLGRIDLHEWGVFTQHRAIALPGMVIDGREITRVEDVPPMINDRGDVVFLADHDGGTGVFTQDKLVWIPIRTRNLNDLPTKYGVLRGFSEKWYR